MKLGLYVKQTIASYKKLQAMHSTCRQKIGSCKSLLEEQLDKFNAPQAWRSRETLDTSFLTFCTHAEQ